MDPRWKAVPVLLALLVVASCSRGKPQSAPGASAPQGAAPQITGAGSTFVYPLMSKWTAEYVAAHPDVHVNYQAIGSGAGIQQVSTGTVDFGATDGPMKDEEIAASRVGPLLHVPVAMGASVAAYNLPGVAGELRLSPDVLAGIFLGRITLWNDPAITALNGALRLPALPIVVVHRSDGSGTTFIWTDYLSKVSPEWKSRVGSNTAVRWPTGVGAKGNDGVAGLVRQTPGALGYIELIYADQNGIPYASIRNAAGAWIKPSAQSVTAAAASAQVPDDFRYSITNPPGKDAYPIAGTTWILLPVRGRDAARHAALVEFVKWVVGPGQAQAGPLHYSPLPAPLVTRVNAALAAVH